MTDFEKTLELLIKLGVMGREDAQAVRQLLAEADQEAPNDTERGRFPTANERQLTRIISAAERLQCLREVAAAETAAHRKRLEELDKEAIAWMRAHGASPEAIAQAEEARRRELAAAEAAPAHRSMDQRQSGFDVTYQAENERKAQAGAALKPANLDKPGATGALSGPALNEGVSQTRQKELGDAMSEKERSQKALEAASRAVTDAAHEKTVTEAGRESVASAGRKNAGRSTTGTEEVRTQTAVQSQTERGEVAEVILRTQAGRLPYAFEQLASATGKTHAQIEAILRQILAQQRTFNDTVNGMAGQLAQLIAEHQLTKAQLAAFSGFASR